MHKRLTSAAKARARAAVPSRRMWAQAVIRAGSGALFILIAHELSNEHLAHAVHTFGWVGVSLALYSMATHIESHVMDAIIRALVLVREWWAQIGAEADRALLRDLGDWRFQARDK